MEQQFSSKAMLSEDGFAEADNATVVIQTNHLSCLHATPKLDRCMDAKDSQSHCRTAHVHHVTHLCKPFCLRSLKLCGQR